MILQLRQCNLVFVGAADCGLHTAAVVLQLTVKYHGLVLFLCGTFIEISPHDVSALSPVEAQ